MKPHLAEDGRRYRELIEMHSGEFPQFREQLDSITAERDRLAARCEALEAALREIERHHIKLNDMKKRPAVRSHTIAMIRAALSSPASDAADSTDGETK